MPDVENAAASSPAESIPAQTPAEDVSIFGEAKPADQIAESAPAEIPESEPQGESVSPPEGAKQPETTRSNAETRKQQLADDIHELLRQRAQIQAENAQMQRREPELKEPKEDQFENYADYIKATAEFSAKKALIVERQQMAQAQYLEQQKQVESQVTQSWGQRVQTAKAQIPELDKSLVTFRDTIPRNATMDGFIVDSDLGPQLIHEFVKNPDEALRIAQLSPYQSAREMTRLEERLQNQAKGIKPKATAPKPPPQATGKAASPAKRKDPWDVLYS